MLNLLILILFIVFSTPILRLRHQIQGKVTLIEWVFFTW